MEKNNPIFSLMQAHNELKELCVRMRDKQQVNEELRLTALKAYNNVIIGHQFLEEQKIMPFVKEKGFLTDSLLAKLRFQHEEIRKRFEQLDEKGLDVEFVTSLGEYMYNHMVMEEEEFYEVLAENITEAEYDSVREMLKEEE